MREEIWSQSGYNRLRAALYYESSALSLCTRCADCLPRYMNQLVIRCLDQFSTDLLGEDVGDNGRAKQSIV